METEDHMPGFYRRGRRKTGPLKELSAHGRMTAAKCQFSGKTVGHELSADITLPVEEEGGRRTLQKKRSRTFDCAHDSRGQSTRPSVDPAVSVPADYHSPAKTRLWRSLRHLYAEPGTRRFAQQHPNRSALPIVRPISILRR